VEENNSPLLPHMDFSFPRLLRLLSDEKLGDPKHAQLLQAAYRFGSVYRTHGRFSQAGVLLGRVWTLMKQKLDPTALQTAKDIDSIMVSAADSPYHGKVAWRPTNSDNRIPIHKLFPLFHSIIISYYHQGNLHSASSFMSILMKIQDEGSEKQHKCLCAFETIRIKSIISQYHGDSQGSEILAREAYEGFKATLGPSHYRTLFACTGYLSTLTPSSSKDELASVTALEFERIAGAEANITRYAQYMSSSIYLLHEDPDFAVNRFHAMLEPNIKKGLFSYDQRIPILDEPTLRIMIDLGWANIRAYIKHKGED
jgi:hypothetical protein